MPIVKTAELTFQGGMRFEAELGSGARITYDDSSNGGPGPIEVVLATLAACSAMDVVSIALKKRQELTSYRIHVRGDQRDAYPKIYTRIDVVHEFEGPDLDTTALARCIELSAEKYCPVSAMISASDTEVHHRYRIVRPDGGIEEDVVMVTGPDRRPEPLPGRG